MHGMYVRKDRGSLFVGYYVCKCVCVVVVVVVVVGEEEYPRHY